MLWLLKIISSLCYLTTSVRGYYVTMTTGRKTCTEFSKGNQEENGTRSLFLRFQEWVADIGEPLPGQNMDGLKEVRYHKLIRGRSKQCSESVLPNSPLISSLFFILTILMFIFTIRCSHEAGKWLLATKADRMALWKSGTKPTLISEKLEFHLQCRGRMLYCFGKSIWWAELSFWHCSTQDYFGATQLLHSVQYIWRLLSQLKLFSP